VTGNRGEQAAVRKNTTYATIIWAFIVAGVGVLLLYLSGRNDLWETRAGAQALGNNLGATLVVTGGLTLLWDLVGRRAFAEEVLSKAQVSADIRAAGLERVTMQWIDDVEWAQMFSQAREIEVFLSYGRTWRSNQWSRLEEASRKRGIKLWVYLPDPEDKAVMQVLAQRYSTIAEALVASVEESAEAFASLMKPRGADVRVYYRSGDPTFACYRFDQRIVATLYSHSRTRGDIPTFVLGGGTLYDFFRNELAVVRAQSTLLDTESLQRGTQS
jgi:hypothetical protein